MGLFFSSDSQSRGPSDQSGQAQQAVYNVNVSGGGKKSHTDVDVHVRPPDYGAIEDAAAIAVASAEGNVAVAEGGLNLAGDVSDDAFDFANNTLDFATDVVSQGIAAQQQTLADFSDMQETAQENVLAFAAGSQTAAYDFAGEAIDAANLEREAALTFAGEAQTAAYGFASNAWDAANEERDAAFDFADDALASANITTQNALIYSGEAQQASYDFASATVGNVAGLLSAGQDIAASAIASNEQIVNTALGIVNSNVGVVERTANSAIDALTLSQAESLETITNQAQDSLVYAGGAMQQLAGGYTVALDELGDQTDDSLEMIVEAAQSESAQGVENVIGLTQNVILGLAALLGATIFFARR